jgi:hypothetical protein
MTSLYAMIANQNQSVQLRISKKHVLRYVRMRRARGGKAEYR